MNRSVFALLLVALALAGCSDKSTSPTNKVVTRQIDDLNYVRGTYFFIQLPNEQLAGGATVDFATLRVFVDDENGANNQGTRSGYGEIDPTAAPGGSPRFVAAFDELQPLAGYEVTFAPYGDRFPVLILKHPISVSQVLAVAYEENLPGGGRRTVGSVPVCAGANCDSVRLRLLQAPHDLYQADGANPDMYEDDLAIAPFNAVRDHELKNVYDLGFRNFAPSDLQIEVRRHGAQIDEPDNAVIDNGDVIGYLQILGIDCFKDFGTGAPAVGADELVDGFTNASFLDPARGILYFPDLRPFDPRLDGRPDANPADNEFFKSRIAGVDTSIPGLRKRVLWPRNGANPPGSTAPKTPLALESNPNVYDKRTLQATADRRFYLDVRGPEGLAH